MLAQLNLLPFKQKVDKYFWTTVALTGLVLIIAIYSIINPDTVYTTTALNQAYYPSDLGILFFGIPFFLIAFWKLYRGKFIGIILWISALFFTLYSYALYLLGIPYGFFFWIYLVIVGLSLYMLVMILCSIDYEKGREKFIEKTPTRFASIVLIGLGLLIFFRVIGLVVTAIMDDGSIFQIDIALWITDFVIAAPALIFVGIQLWRKKSFALITAPGMLLQYIVLSLGLIPVFIYQAEGNLAAIDMGGLIVIVCMIAICAILFIQLIKSLKEKSY